MRGVIVKDRRLRLPINHETLVADVLQRVCLHTIGVVREIGGLRGHPDAGNLARNAAGFLEALWLAGLRLNARCTKLFHVSE